MIFHTLHPVEGLDFIVPPLLRVRGIGNRGFWSVANGLTDIDMGSRCNDEWQKRLVKVKQESRISGAAPYSSAGRPTALVKSPTREHGNMD
jgi:hypothetical protein